MRFPIPLLIPALLAPLWAITPEPGISAASILARTKILSSDEFEGRAPGSAGEEKTVAYVSDEFRKLGLAPGNPDGTYVQDVPLVGITSDPTLSFTIAGRRLTLENRMDFIGPTSRLTRHLEVKDSDVVFVGYGAVAPEYDWDDFKGVDVRGKTVVMLVNDPPVVDPKTGQLDPKMFGGVAMTYYGRWTYKYEIASERGAAACLIVHETQAASYPFSVVVNSNSRENFEIRAADGNAGHVAMQGWLTLDAARRLFTAAGQDYDALKRAAARRDFHPVSLGMKASFTIDSTLRNVESHNLIGILPGRDPKLRSEYVFYSAHWDHLGRDATLKGDQIYNGAVDNAAGVALLLEVAHAFAALPPAQRPARSIVFLSPTAEEKGMLGSRYYVQHPLYPLERTLADLNTDSPNPFGATEDLEIVGLGASTIDATGQAVAQEQGRVLVPDSRPERGWYYRSDHFEFAKQGVPGYYPNPGHRLIGQPAGTGDKLWTDFWAHHYHQVADEVQPTYTFEGAAHDAAFLFEVGRRLANAAAWPEWSPRSEFKARRDAMLHHAASP